jgi:hypothetical protein
MYQEYNRIMSRRRISVLVISMLLSVSAYATDWRMYGDDGDDQLWLYSASDLARDGNNVRVWTEVLSMKDVLKFLDTNKAHPEAARKAAARVKAGYIPPFAVYNKFDSEGAGSVALTEEVAEELGTPVRAKVLYEFDCAAGRIRALQGSNHVPGHEETLDVPQPWKYIAPDTYMAELKSWVCKRS